MNINLPAPQPIREVHDIDRARFDGEIRPVGEPVVLRGLAADWPAVAAARRSSQALVGYLEGFATAEPVGVLLGAPEIGGLFGYDGPDLGRLNFTRAASPMPAIFARLLGEADRAHPVALAIQSTIIARHLPGFERANRTALLDEAIQPRIWIGNAITVSTHSDTMENIAVNVAGRRRFTLFPPSQVGNLYLGPLQPTPSGTPVSLVDPDAPDLRRFPRFADAAATARVALLQPGDALYIPFLWYHHVRSLDPVNVLANYWWSDARSEGPSPSDAMLFARAALAGLPADQRHAWRGLFDHYVFNQGGDPAEHLPAAARGPLAALAPAVARRLREGVAALLAQLARP